MPFHIVRQDITKMQVDAIINGRYDILEINEVLFQYDQPLLDG